MTDIKTIEKYLLEAINDSNSSNGVDDDNTIDFNDLEELLARGKFVDHKLEYKTVTGDFPGYFKIEEHFGGEGQGTEYFVVFSYDNGNGEKEYFRFDGYYISWDGTDYEGTEIFRVVPKEVIVRQWERA